jgi:hypothetical protein
MTSLDTEKLDGLHLRDRIALSLALPPRDTVIKHGIRSATEIRRHNPPGGKYTPRKKESLYE